MTETPSPANPYIGPRSFETGERLYGRERELRALLHLLIAERVVLLYSPSGAGKSSLIKAALIPALARRDFVTLPPIRVNQELPHGAPPQANRYVYSTLLSLEERLPADQRLDEAALPGLSLLDYIQQRVLPETGAQGLDPVLLFDQFEEVLTVEPTNLAAKHAFFAQLGQILADRRVWALLAMREDYLAALDPYLGAIPSRFKDTFRLDLLGVQAACQAMQGPARAAGVVFTDEAAGLLADELRRTTVQRTDGTREQVLGPHVEPVQLQVVCLRLWDKLFGQAVRRAREITPDDITDVGDVDSALAGYYVDRVAAAAASTGVSERAIRDWFDRELITAQGQRSQVMREPGSSGGLDNCAIDRLIDAHLVRADQRHGVVWYELAHDRLVAPVRTNNLAWRQAALTAFQRQALLWEEQDQSEGLLLQGQALHEAERWAEQHAAELTEGEQDFLEACRKARAIQEQQERANRRIRFALVAVACAALLAAGLAAYALQLSRTNMRQARLARINELAAQSSDLQDEIPAHSLQIALVAHSMLQAEDPPNPAVQGSLEGALTVVNGDPLCCNSGEVRALTLSGDGRLVITGGQDAAVRIWDTRPLTPTLRVLRQSTAAITALELSRGGKWLAAGNADGTVYLWDLEEPRKAPLIHRGQLGSVRAVRFSPDGRWLASSAGATVRVWSVDRPELAVEVPPTERGDVLALTFSPNGTWLAAGQRVRVLLWRLADLSSAPVVLEGHTDTVKTLAFSRDEQVLASAGDDTTVRLWRLAQSPPSAQVLSAHTGAVNSVAFSPDGALLASAGDDNTVRSWRLDALERPAQVLGRFNRPALALAFSPDGKLLAGVSADYTGLLWLTDALDRPPVLLAGHSNTLRSLAFSADSRVLVTGGDEPSVRVWQMGAIQELPYLLKPGFPEKVSVPVLSQDGRWLALAHIDGLVQVRQLTDTERLPLRVPRQAGQIGVLQLSPDGSRLAMLSDARRLQVWRTGPLPPQLVIELPLEQPVSVFVWSGDGQKLAVAGEDRRVRIVPLDAGQTAVELDSAAGVIRDLAFSPDGAWLAGVGDDRRAVLWRADGSQPPSLPSGVSGPITRLTFSPDAAWLALSGEDPTVWLWRPTASDPARELRGHTDAIRSQAFSHDGRWLATGSRDNTIRVWDLRDPQLPPAVLRGHARLVSALEFSQDDTRLVSGSVDGTVRVWQMDAGHTLLMTLKGGFGVMDVRFSPSGRRIVALGDDGTVALWMTDQQELLEQACLTIGRNLTIGEWANITDAATGYTRVCANVPTNQTVYQALVVRGDLDAALKTYTEELQRFPNLDPPSAWLVQTAGDLISADQPEDPLQARQPSRYREQALALYARARALDPTLKEIPAVALRALCGYGSLPASTPAVLDACERLVRFDPDEPSFYVLLARARARQ